MSGRLGAPGHARAGEVCTLAASRQLSLTRHAIYGHARSCSRSRFVSSTWRRTEADASLLALLGLPPDASITHTQAIAELAHPDDRERHHAAVLQALDPNSNGDFYGELRILRPDGSERRLATSGRVEFAGEPRRAVRLSGVVVDITERKRREQT